MIGPMCTSSIFILSLSLSLVSSGGPVYINPQQAVVPQPQSTEAPSLLTQTVYGFLDFTTTIGNTVMVFSPQSSPAAGGNPESKPSTSTTVIETKPSVVSPTSDIAPSKTIEPAKTEQKEEKPQKPQTISKKPSIVEVKPSSKQVILSSIVEVRGGPTSPPAVKPSSIVEVRTGSAETKKDILSSKVEIKQAPSSIVEVRTGVNVKSNVVESQKPASSIVNVQVGTPKPIVNVKVGIPKPAILSSKVEVISSSDEPAISGNNLDGPAEYDFLSRQPSEVVDETYKVYDIRPNTKLNHKNRATLEAKHRHAATKAIDARHPVGLVTSMGGTVVKDGVTTVHETKVIGTFISGKYAQVLQSTSQVFQNHRKPKPTPVSQSKILKTAAPTLPKAAPKPSLEPTPVSTLQEDSALPLEALFSSPGGANLIRTSRRPAIGNVPFKNRFNRNKAREETKEQELEPEREQVEQVVATSSQTPSYKKNRNRGNQGNRSTFKLSNNRFARPSATQELATVSVYSEPAPSSNRRKQSSQPRRGGFRPSSNAVDSNSNSNANSRDSRRSFKPKPSAPLSDQTSSTSVYKFKLQRPSGRWQYKTTPKPRISIRRQDDDNTTLTLTDKEMKLDPDQELSGSDVVQSADQNSTSPTSTASTLPIETIKVEISTPAEFKNTYYEIATIKSPYTFQVGTLKNTRYITVTSTLEKSLVEPTEAPSMSTEPLTENILATTANAYDKEPPLDSSIATLPPIGLAGDAETPPLETMTETFSTTQLLLKTHILPVVYGGTNTSRYTLVQSYHITRIVSAIKTLPPMEVYQFVPSKTLNEFNTRLDEAGSELHLELEFGDNNDQDDDEHPHSARAFPPDLDLANVGSDFDLSDVDKSRFPEHLRLKKAHSTSTPPPEPTTPALSNEQLQQLALLRFLNPNAAIPQVITTSKPVLKLETVYESHVIPIFNGQSTILSTLSRPIATLSKTEYEYGTSTLAMPQPIIQSQINPLFPQQQQQFAITSSPVVTQTMVTATESKVLKLTFGAKTAYTTLFSTRVVPTVLTTYLTASVPVQPTAQGFPGFFPAPYNPFSFVG